MRWGLLAVFVVPFFPSVAEAREPVAWERLPLGKVTSIPGGQSLPASIKATEKVPGFTPTVEDQGVMFGDETGCVAYDYSKEVSHGGWGDWLQPELRLSRNTGPQRVVHVHVERVVEDSGTTSLESVDVLVDLKTLGVRLRERATLPLASLGVAPGGARIFAGRQAGPDGKQSVEFVVTRPLGGVEIRHNQGNPSSDSRCAHQRVSLAADGDGAVIRGQADTRHGFVRPLRIDMSVSQTSRDETPVVSLSTTWTGPEASTQSEDEMIDDRERTMPVP